MPAIRNIAVGLPVKDGHLLALEGHDASRGLDFLRAIGGGIEFGETAAEALGREFMEELGVTLEGAEPLGVFENIFTYEGAPGHEIAHVFAVTSAELDAVPLDAELHPRRGQPGALGADRRHPCRHPRPVPRGRTGSTAHPRRARPVSVRITARQDCAP
ncbi:NUDIX domain-containing protein [Microbacterium sp. CGR1]|uniref:NUDIX domain-containing protein n=1 Tax=Microbacterium sp. CGR1 TaxID=1696072 RepID=UPI00069EFE76|nr:NUDIX domain-containing protein [Microbacterium sp. CGR1]